MNTRGVWFTAAIAAGLMAAPVAHGDVIIKLKNGVEIKVPVDKDDIASITMEEGGKTAAAPVEPSLPPAPAPSRPAPEPQGLPSGGDASLPGASSFRQGAFGAPGARAGTEAPRAAAGAAGSPRTIRIGKGKEVQRLGDVAASLQNGDVVEIDGGVYLNDFAVITASNVTLKGVNGRPHFQASVSPPDGKALWTISGDDVTVDNIEFSGVEVDDQNGAGIRAEGGKLTVRNSYFHHNQFGLLSANNPDQEVVIANSEVAYNKRKDTFAHGIYIGHIRKFTLVNSYVHRNHRGQEVKTRAQQSYIIYNRITDEDGIGSYLIDASNCGKLVVLGNVLQKGADAENMTGIAFGAEGCQGAGHKLWVVNNTYLNGARSGAFVKNFSGDVGNLINNLIIDARPYAGSMTVKNNVEGTKAMLADPDKFDFRLKPGATAAIDKGADPGSLDGFSLKPVQEYVHPMKARKRASDGKLDVGAYEFTK
jgi:hypothetical protein